MVQRIYATTIQEHIGLDNLLTALSICMGIFILVFTLMEWGSASGVKSYILHKNAEDLNTLQSKIEYIIAKNKTAQYVLVTWDETESLRLEYEKIKGECTENHIPTDDYFFLTSKRHSPEFKYLNLTDLNAALTWLQWIISSVSYYIVFWALTIYIIWYAFSKILSV